MSELFEKSMATLELPQVLALLADCAATLEGKERCLALRPLTDLDDVARAQEETSAAVKMLILRGSPGFSGVKPVSASLQRADMGGSLSTRELLDIASVLRCARGARDYGDSEEKTVISHLFRSLTPNRFLEDSITNSILSEEEIADSASSELASIRRHMRSTEARVRDILQRLISSNQSKYLQESIITIRSDRYVVPVKAEHKNAIPGLVHDVSSSGSTFFIEPMGVVKANNELRELAAREKKEIERILAELSAQCAADREDIAEDYDLLVWLDAIFARGRLSLNMEAAQPRLSDRYLRLRKARHPLLDRKKAVANDLELGDRFDTLMITGPNTGGKTVTLKTIGLLTLMAQCGLHIPTGSDSTVRIFDRVLADIGDEQSIAQSLSTFSSHMTNIVGILQEADDRTLILFDELGAGTDPTEGAALAIAILNYLHDRGIRTMATTHYSELKIYALSTNFVENACCEFDVETLRPTYRLLIGIPGKSNAFAISKKLGLSDEIIEAAKEQIDEQDVSFEDVISDLEKSRVTIEKERREIEDYKKEIEALRHKLQEKNDKIDQTRDRILREANEKARDILREAKDTADETIRIFQKAGPGASMKDLEQARQKLRSNIDDKNSKLSVAAKDKPKAPALKPEQLKKGDAVRIVSMGLKGTVSSLPDAKGNLFVQCGIMRTSTNIKDLVRIEEATITTPTMSNTNTGKLRMSKSFSVSPEINLLGKTVDEALAALDKYLDDAYLAHLENVRVVHGKGTGALRKAIQQHLKRIKYVKSFRQGEYGEGDAGVTIVEFKK